MIFGIVLTGLVVVILAGSYFAYKYAFYFVDNRTEEECLAIPSGKQYEKQQDFMRELMQEMKKLAFEEVSITSFDGKKLVGRYYHQKDDAPLQIMMHGYRSDYIRDFCGGHRSARAMGMNTLVVDQRAHGKSEGHTITFGICERKDCLSWINYAKERFGKGIPIFLVGLSMGAATVLMASELELPENVKGIIADCPYSSPKEIICRVGGMMKLPVKLVYPLVVLGARLFGHFDLEETSAVEAVKHAKVPILLIHGEADLFVPCDMSRAIYASGKSRITLETFPDAGHGISYILDSERYERVVKTFIEKCLQK